MATEFASGYVSLTVILAKEAMKDINKQVAEAGKAGGTTYSRFPADIRATFADQCYFGCEADDPMTALAFGPDYAGTRLRAMFASDLEHWDVSDACAVLPEAWELVERGHVTADDFNAFTDDNALALWGDEMFGNTVTTAR